MNNDTPALKEAEPRTLWVFCEGLKGELKKVSIEVLCEARRLGDRLGGDVCAILFGDGIADLAAMPSRYGADKTYVAESKSATEFDVETPLTVIAGLIAEDRPKVVLFGATALSKDLAPRVAARTRASLITQCAELKIDDDGRVLARRPVYGGKAHATLACSAYPLVATIPAGTLTAREPDCSRQGKIVSIQLEASQDRTRGEFISLIKGDPKSMDLSEAEAIVAVGKGMGKKENLDTVQELADLLGACVGGSRVSVDMGWVSKHRQIGMTGKAVKPRLLISCGISGQHAHVSGIEGTGIVVAINTDRNAPIFKVSNLSILGDLNEVVPALITEIRKRNVQRERQ